MSGTLERRKFEQFAGSIQRELSDIDKFNLSAFDHKSSVGADHVEPKDSLMTLEWNDIHPLEVFSTMLVS
jgi:hypothetical protein